MRHDDSEANGDGRATNPAKPPSHIGITTKPLRKLHHLSRRLFPINHPSQLLMTWLISQIGGRCNIVERSSINHYVCVTCWSGKFAVPRRWRPALRQQRQQRRRRRRRRRL